MFRAQHTYLQFNMHWIHSFVKESFLNVGMIQLKNSELFWRFFIIQFDNYTYFLCFACIMYLIEWNLML